MTESLPIPAAPAEVPEGDAPLPVLPPTDPLPEAPEPIAVPTDAPAVTDSVESEPAGDPLVELHAAVLQLVAASEKHHQRAAHRESVIDNLHAELEKLRTGERRATVRPLLVAMARLRDDLVKQSSELPDDFDTTRAQNLLYSFADSIEITLEDFGVATYRPEPGDEFDPRRHKAVTSEPTSDGELVRTVAGVRKDGYQDIEAGVTLAQAEVTVYVQAPEPLAAEASESASPASGSVDGAPMTACPTAETTEAPAATPETPIGPSVG